jgi:DNA polymerase I
MKRRFREVWLVDFEFTSKPGHPPVPICMVARELYSSRVVRLNHEELRRHKKAPFDVGPDCLFVAFYASAEFGVFLALGWPLPVYVADLHAEFRNLTNGSQPPHGNSLLGALLTFGLPPGDAVQKDEMRQLAMRGAPFTAGEMRALISYCESDVRALNLLWSAMESLLGEDALLRGEFIKAVAIMEWRGIPIDTSTHGRLVDRWDSLKLLFVTELDPQGEIWDGFKFSYARFERWLEMRQIVWPRLPSGKLNLQKETWQDMALGHPDLKPYATLHATLGKLRLSDLAIGPDGRNRVLLSPFRSTTGRNQPSTNQFIFGLPSFWRPLIHPQPETAVAYLDWARQEFGIAAFLSGDLTMQAAYQSSDPYMAFAIQAGAAPPWATEHTHPEIRAIFKMVVLGVGYGMSAYGLATRLGVSLSQATDLLALHRKCYPVFWRWVEAAVDYAQLNGRLSTRYRWNFQVTGIPNIRSLGNFPCQANGAEMMRLAAIYAVREGIRVCAPVHDAFLIEAPINEIEHEMGRMKSCMARASAAILQGFELKTDAKEFKHPGRFGNIENPLWKIATEFAANPTPDRNPPVS